MNIRCRTFQELFDIVNCANQLEEEEMENDEAKRRDGERSISDVSKVLSFY